MRDVSAKATRPLLDVLEGEVDLQALVAGLPVTLDQLRDTKNRIGWDVFADLLERVDELRSPMEIGARISNTLDVLFFVQFLLCSRRMSIHVRLLPARPSSTTIAFFRFPMLGEQLIE